MVTFSLCMIVKNEETILKRCLDSMADLFDEIIIVDTGSTDSTKSIALEYTSKVYDFQWKNDFSAARNYSFSLATMDYIYSADADEYLDEENRYQLRLLKQNMYPEIEIVQMMYNTISDNTVLNIKKEYRPKLFKRLRTFTWIDPIHESVRLEPLVFDSDVVITHAPVSNHAHRDFKIYKSAIEKDGNLSLNVFEMMLIELYKCGTAFDFATMADYIQDIRSTLEDSPLRDATTAVLCKHSRLNQTRDVFLTYAADKTPSTSCSEVLYELGLHYMEEDKLPAAIEYLQMAIDEREPVIDVHAGGDLPMQALIECYQAMMQKDPANMETYHHKMSEIKCRLEKWTEPEEQPIE